MNDDAPVILDVQNGLGRIRLNRPKALNSLDLDMVHLIAPQLAEWAADPAVGAVLIDGAGDRAFCAGGDIRALFDNRGSDFGATFYGTEYLLNIAIKNFPKPYIALMDGVTMGGGVGLSVHGSHRIASERTLFAMPETGIGFFPDVGGGWFLPRCPGETGMFLGLTGFRMKAADCLEVGVCDAHIPSNRLDAFIEELADSDDKSPAAVDAIIADFAEPTETPAVLSEHRNTIDRIFAGESVEPIVAALGEESGEWVGTIDRMLAGKSPTALKVTHRLIREGAAMTRFEDHMAMEFRLACHFYAGDDLFEGIRAVIVDKDNAPVWQPGDLTSVNEADVAAYFAPVDGAPDFG
jgi:enoyl-CoA hydratase